MPRQINKGPADFCPENCPFMQLQIVNSVLFVNDAPSEFSNTITCTHESACQMWNQTKTASWIIWDGWRGNHDQRIDDDKCSNCGFNHMTVYGPNTSDKLYKKCPGCGRDMISINEI